MLNKNQHISFSGAGASHQNGSAERAIKMLVTMKSTMLSHAALRCPEYKLSTDLWPMETYYDVWIYNRIPEMKSSLSTIDIWSRSRFEPVSETLRKFHGWVCTTYVLEPKLQNPGVNIPK